MTRLTPGAPKKALGQHFLFDASLLKRIAVAGGPVEGKTIIEVGPGPGGLTRALLDAGVGTGLIGSWLGIVGYPHVEGLDISEGMLAVAARKG